MRNVSLVRQALFGVLLILIELFAFAQKKEIVYKSIYQQSPANISFPLPDTILQRLGMAAQNIKVPLGNFLYRNYYNNGLSRTDFSFEAADGIRTRGASSAVFFSRLKDSAFFLFQNDSLLQAYSFQLPKLVKTGETKTISRYSCDAYRFDEDSSKGIIWFSKQLPFWVSPGIYYKSLGGIVQIDYFFTEGTQSVELLSFERTNEKVDFRKGLPKPKGKRKIHFVFKRSS